MDIEKLSDEELIRRYCEGPSDSETREELARRLLPRLRTMIRKLAFAQGFCPQSEDHFAFLDDAVALASENAIRRICGFKFKGPFDHWLAKVARTAALDQRKSVVGRFKKTIPPVFTPLDAAATRAVEKDRAGYRSTHWVQVEEDLVSAQREDIIGRLLTLHAQGSNEDAISAASIRCYTYDNYPTARIAEMQGLISEAKVFELFEKDYRKLRDLFRRFGVRGPADI